MAEGQRCNPLATFEFASVAQKPFTMDWTEWLDGAILTAASVVSSDQTLLLVDTVSFTAGGFTIVTFWARGQDNGIGEVLVTVRVTASDGRIDAQSYLYNVNDPGA